MAIIHTHQPHEPWNKGKLIGQKAPLKLKDIWAIRIRLQLGQKVRDLALFDLAIDSKLRACDLVKLRVSDVSHGRQMASRVMVMQQKTGRPVQFEITQSTREAVQAWITHADLKASDFLFATRGPDSPHLSTRQYARIVHRWVEEAGLESGSYGTHTMRRTKASLIYRRTRNLRAVQLLLGHTKLESTVRYLGIEVDDALEIAEQTDVCVHKSRSLPIEGRERTSTNALFKLTRKAGSARISRQGTIAARSLRCSLSNPDHLPLSRLCRLQPGCMAQHPASYRSRSG